MQEIRLLTTWPCGCRSWTRTILGDDVKTIVEKLPAERFEPCNRFAELVGRRDSLQDRADECIVQTGRPDRALLRELEAAEGEIERHHTEQGMSRYEVLED